MDIEKRDLGLAQLCEDAFLGAATIDIMALGKQLKLREFNPTREVQKPVVNSIKTMLMEGISHINYNPLVVSITQDSLLSSSLSNSYDPQRQSPSLKSAKFISPTGPAVYVLSGFQRVTAVRLATEALGKKKEKLEKDLEKTMGCVGSDSYDEGDSAGEGVHHTSIKAIGQEIAVVERLMEGCTTWPAYFYDLGSFLCLSLI